MSRFDGEMIKNMLDVPKEEWQEKACVFSEGNKELEEFLLFLWEKGFNTIGCCAGHEEEECAVPYISIDVTKLSRVQLRNMLKVLYFNIPSGVSAVLTNRYDGGIQKRYAIYFNDYNARFQYVQNLFSCVLKIDKEVEGNVLMEADQEKFETLSWAMGLDLEDYAKSLVVPSVNFFEIQNMNSKDFFMFISRCVELEGIESQRELKEKIKKTNEFDGYLFSYKENGEVKTLSEEDLERIDKLNIILAEKGMAGKVMNNEMIRETLKFLEEKEMEKQ